MLNTVVFLMMDRLMSCDEEEFLGEWSSVQSVTLNYSCMTIRKFDITQFNKQTVQQSNRMTIRQYDDQTLCWSDRMTIRQEIYLHKRFGTQECCKVLFILILLDIFSCNSISMIILSKKRDNKYFFFPKWVFYLDYWTDVIFH